MPIYEYQCQSCGHELEKLQRMSDDALTDCPHCGKSSLKRLISAAAFRLKGSGWYETDFKKDNQRNLVDSGGSSGGSAATASADSAKGTSSESSKDSGKSSAKADGKDSAKAGKSTDSGSSKPAEKSTKSSSAPASS
jgi:putative FmdB family regulatory protein